MNPSEQLSAAILLAQRVRDTGRLPDNAPACLGALVELLQEVERLTVDRNALESTLGKYERALATFGSENNRIRPKNRLAEQGDPNPPHPCA